MRVYSGIGPRHTIAEPRKKIPVNTRISGPISGIRRDPLQAGGRRFDPGWLHRELPANKPDFAGGYAGAVQDVPQACSLGPGDRPAATATSVHVGEQLASLSVYSSPLSYGVVRVR